MLPEPYEYLDLHDGERMTLRITAYEDNSGLIHPKTVTPRHVTIYMQQNNLPAAPAAGTPISNEVPVLRVMGQRLDEFSPMTYWDISSKRLRSDLLSRFQHGQGLPMTVTLTAHGKAPHKIYSVEVLAS